MCNLGKIVAFFKYLSSWDIPNFRVCQVRKIHWFSILALGQSPIQSEDYFL